MDIVGDQGTFRVYLVPKSPEESDNSSQRDDYSAASISVSVHKKTGSEQLSISYSDSIRFNIQKGCKVSKKENCCS